MPHSLHHNRNVTMLDQAIAPTANIKANQGRVAVCRDSAPAMPRQLEAMFTVFRRQRPPAHAVGYGLVLRAAGSALIRGADWSWLSTTLSGERRELRGRWLRSIAA